MAWTTEEWVQDDSVFYGYPIPSGTAEPVPSDISNVQTRWIFDNAFSGYPHISTLTPVPSDTSNVPTKWKFDDKFYGYPHVCSFPVKSHLPVITDFFIAGIGADFKQMQKGQSISLPEQIYFKFDLKERMTL